MSTKNTNKKRKQPEVAMDGELLEGIADWETAYRDVQKKLEKTKKELVETKELLKKSEEKGGSSEENDDVIVTRSLPQRTPMMHGTSSSRNFVSSASLIAIVMFHVLQATSASG